MNAANEVAVGAYLAGRLQFGDIPAVIDKVLAADWPRTVSKIEEILEADAQAREGAVRWAGILGKRRHFR